MPTVTNRQEIGKIGYSHLYTLVDDSSAFFFEAGMMIDADGAYRAYHPDNKSGLDYLGNAGKPGNWWALVTDNGQSGGKPLIQQNGDPAPGFYISTTSLEDTGKIRTDPHRYVDSETFPFIVLPAKGKFGAKLGDLAMVYNPKSKLLCGGIFADEGPAGEIGEASIAMARAMDVPDSPKHGGQAHGLIYVVFPNSRKGWPLNTDDLQQHTNNSFNKWGGLNKLRLVMPEYF